MSGLWIRTGRVNKIFYFHYDPIKYSDEALNFAMVDFDVDNDNVNDPEITKYPVWYAYKKMTHFEEHFNEDEFSETDGTQPWYRKGWQFRNLTDVRIEDGILSCSTICII